MTRGHYLRASSIPGHGKPTAKQREAWEAVGRTGSQIEAATAIGISQSALQTRMHGYQHAMGTKGPLPGARVYKNGITRGTGPWAQLRATVAAHEATIARLEAELDAAVAAHQADLLRLMERIGELSEQAHPWVEVHARLDAIERAVASRSVAVVTHRRQADGGVGGKRERKAAA